jgi:hypothetical protein
MERSPIRLLDYETYNRKRKKCIGSRVERERVTRQAKQAIDANVFREREKQGKDGFEIWLAFHSLCTILRLECPLPATKPIRTILSLWNKYFLLSGTFLSSS